MMSSKSFAEPVLAAATPTPAVALNHRGGRVALEIIVTGTINFDLQSTNSDLQAGVAGQWLVDTATNAGITASKWITFNGTPAFIRLLVNTITAGATVTLNWTQADV